MSRRMRVLVSSDEEEEDKIVGNKKERAPSASRVLSNGRNTPLDFSAFQYSPPHPPASSVNPKKTSLQLLPVPSPGEPSPLPPALPSTARPTPPSAESTSSESVFVIGSSDDAEASEADRKLVKRAAPKRATDMSEGEGRSKKLILAAGSSEDEPEAEDVETASEDDGGDGSEEEEASLDELLAALLSRVEPLSHRIRSALESWAAGGSCSVHRITADEVAAISPPGKTLKAYQLAGLNWAWLMRNVKCNGVLADEMGLGKTVQAAILLGWLSRHCGVDGPHLVVAPASTLANWQRELTLWCPKLRIVVYSGTGEERRALRGRKLSTCADIVISSYTWFERDASVDDRAFLKKQQWEYLIADEAHGVRSDTTGRYQRLRKLSSKRKLLLTGTPVQNNLSELFVMMRFAMPSVFLEEDAVLFQEDSTDDAHLSRVRSLVEPFVLRRLKSTVLSEMEPKIEVVSKFPMSAIQAGFYNSLLKQARDRKRAAAGGKKSGPSASTVVDLTSDAEEEASASHLSDISSIKLSAGVVKHLYTDLRKAANHPVLLSRHYVADPERLRTIAALLHRAHAFGPHATLTQVTKELEDNSSDFAIHCMCERYEEEFPALAKNKLPDDYLFDSGKMNHLKTLLPKLISEGHRILLFSQWKLILDVLEVFLRRLMGIPFMRFDGTTSVGDRQDIIDEFTRDVSIPVMLISTRAGGLGINLVAADTVILHDMDFNPHVDSQAEDRVHRMGQTKPVTVYRLVCSNTIDDALLQIQQRKAKLHDAVLKDTAASKKTGAVSSGAMAELVDLALDLASTT